MRIGIKVGSALLTKQAGLGYEIDEEFLSRLMNEVSRLIVRGDEVFLVSSGAVASDSDKSRSRALRAAVGQPILMAKYRSYAGRYQMPPWDVAQLLLVADELKTNRLHIKKIIEEAFLKKVLPVVNANDAVNGTELDRLEQFADNDNLFLAVCIMLKPDAAIIATDVDGVLDEKGQVMHLFSAKDRETTADFYLKDALTAGFGTGGMSSKISVAKCLLEADIKTIIVNGHEENFLIRALHKLEHGQVAGHEFGTVFIK